jgi:hypothetical protein
MSVKWETVKAGDVLWDSRRTKSRECAVSRLSNWPVKIISIDHANGKAIATWNGNAPREYRRKGVERLRRTQKTDKSRAAIWR